MMERMCRLFIFCFGLIAFPPNSVTGHRGYHLVVKPQNVSEVAPQRRAFVTEALTVGNVLVSLWSSAWSDKGIEIDISNEMTTSLNDPTWYMLHGHAAILPPFLIEENEPSAKIKFFKKPSSGFGTEGAASYQITRIPQGTLSLVFMWKVPQLADMGFFVKIEMGALTGEQLKSLFKNVDNNSLWFKSEKLKKWVTNTEQGITWKAAMGTKSLNTLKIVVM
ncbi:uncharacterized protein LOC116299739 [Actinia tenebrosa]|uniref:Uncharacterized protein LOC116299739 n=1 Tax=Actinia tenebrosa TaxID=6105 RepID=A0A6P8IAS4_ACTTE|nr:uncharacterized protein LOC116299739 [Actinia tenebrosa]